MKKEPKKMKTATAVGLAVGLCAASVVDILLLRGMPVSSKRLVRLVYMIGAFGISDAVGSLVWSSVEKDTQEIIDTYSKAAMEVAEEEENDIQEVSADA